MLEAIGTTSLTTTNPWYDGPVTFEGILARDLMDHLGARGQTVTVSALNNYQAEVPVSDFREIGVLLALKADGEYLSVRDKGPIFIIYPFDDDEGLRNETYFARSVWQVTAMRFSGSAGESPTDKSEDPQYYLLIGIGGLALLVLIILIIRTRRS